jgi:hypothetical protein
MPPEHHHPTWPCHYGSWMLCTCQVFKKHPTSFLFLAPNYNRQVVAAVAGRRALHLPRHDHGQRCHLIAPASRGRASVHGRQAQGQGGPYGGVHPADNARAAGSGCMGRERDGGARAHGKARRRHHCAHASVLFPPMFMEAEVHVVVVQDAQQVAATVVPVSLRLRPLRARPSSFWRPRRGVVPMAVMMGRPRRRSRSSRPSDSTFLDRPHVVPGSVFSSRDSGW